MATLAFLFLLSAGKVVSETKIGTWTKENRKEWWSGHLDPSGWPAEQESIRTQLRSIHERLGTAKAFTNRHFVGWLRHLKWLSLFPDEPRDGSFFAKPDAARSFAAVAMEDDVFTLFHDHLSPHDDHSRAAEVLCRIYAAHPKDVREYPSLAVAMALVFDQPFPKGWPHAFVDPDNVPANNTPPEDRFAFIVKSAREEKLMLDPKRLTPAELKFVIDTPVPLDELAHLQKIKLRSPRALEDLFTLIPYAQSRLGNSDYLWPHGKYHVFTIQKKGGLCVDQAYYTAHTAKAKGIPSIVFLGQGVSGAHAWLGYVERYGDWAFDLAKFRQERYPVGRAYDPQTWRKLTDSECEFLDSHQVSSTARAKARNLMSWAELNPDAEFTGALYQLARREAPAYVWAWEAGAKHLADTGAPLEDRLEFWIDWIKAFERQKDLAFRGRKRHLALLEEAGKQSQFEQEIDKLIRENRAKRFDLVIEVAAEQILVKIDAGNWEAARESFLKSMVRLRSKAGGELFYRLVEPYVTLCLEAGRTDLAREAMVQAGKSFEARPGSILHRDLRELSALVNARKS